MSIKHRRALVTCERRSNESERKISRDLLSERKKSSIAGNTWLLSLFLRRKTVRRVPDRINKKKRSRAKSVVARYSPVPFRRPSARSSSALAPWRPSPVSYRPRTAPVACWRYSTTSSVSDRPTASRGVRAAPACPYCRVTYAPPRRWLCGCLRAFLYSHSLYDYYYYYYWSIR